MEKKKQRILIIDDNENMCLILTDILEDEGYDVVTARDGSKGWETIQSGSYDLVITDLILPGIDGLTLLKNIREKGMHIKVIILSGSDEQWVQEDSKNKADGFLTKPIHPQIIKEVISNLLKGIGAK